MSDKKVRSLFDKFLGTEHGKAAPPGRGLETLGLGKSPVEEKTDSFGTVRGNILDKCRKVERFNFKPDLSELSITQVPEEYRILKTNLVSMAEQMNKKSFVISSCHHGEGKTTTAVFLSQFLARNRDQRVLLVDADMRRPKVKRFVGLEKVDVGIEDLIENGAPLEEALVHSIEDNLTILPCRKGHSNAPEIVEQPRTKRLPIELEQHFDYVLYDTSPVLSTTDPAMLGAIVGGVLLVVKAGSTQREAIVHAKSLLEQAGCMLNGLILTQRKEYLPKYFHRYQYYRDYHYYYYSKPSEE